MPERIDEAARARAFWSGTITFGLVSVPVNLFAANRARDVSLRMLDVDGTPLARRYFCPREERPIEREEIVRGYEIEDGTYVIVTDEELAALEPRRSRDIDLRRFVDADEIDPMYFQRSYFLAPAGDSVKAYLLLVSAMEREGKVGIATFVMRGKEYLVAIIAEGGILRAETLRFHDEIRSPHEIGLPERSQPDAGRVRAFEGAIDGLLADRFDPGELTDRYAQRLLELVDRKLEADEDVVEAAEVPEEPEAEPEVIDLMAVLKQSLERSTAGAGGRAAVPGGDGPRASEELVERSKSELYERAKELEIPGRSKMSKDELIDAIDKAS